MSALPDPSASFIGDAAPFDRSDKDLSGADAPTPISVPSLYNDLLTIGPTDPGSRQAATVPPEATTTVDGPTQRRRQTRRLGVAATVLAVLLLVIGLVTSFVTSSASATHESPTTTTGPTSGNQAQAGDHRSLHLPAATSAPLPAPPTLAVSAPIQSHEVFGYAPYWTLPRSSAFDVKNLTTLAYFSVDANGDGTLDQSGPGWNGYQSQDLVNLVTRSHAAGDRVVLTITCFDQHSLDQITSDPNAPARLSAALITAVKGKSLDGVNFDFEGQGRADQVGLTNLITKVSAALHATDPHWQVTMAVYGSAASDPGGFYNVATVAPAVDAFFVMAYDMNSRSTPSATSPLFGSGYTDLRVIEDFVKLMPSSKIVLGLPYYGYDWPTTDGSATATATGGESPLTDASIAAGNHPTYWDPVTDSPWTAYQVGTQWHKTYFDDPTSLALKAQLANYFHIAGVGIWALGMDNNNPGMLAALLGNAPVTKDILSGPPTGTGYLNFATFAGVLNVALDPITPPPTGGTSQLIGFLGGIGTTDPTLACLSSGPALPVWSFTTLPGVYVVIASTPTDCAAAMWSFSIPPGTPTPTPPTTTTTHPLTPTTTSTSPAPTSTTTSTSMTTTTTTTSTSTSTSTSPP
jgi:spore germination protein YaaH